MTIEIDPATGAPIVKSPVSSPDVSSDTSEANVGDKFKAPETSVQAEANTNQPPINVNAVETKENPSAEISNDAPLKNLIRQAELSNRKLAIQNLNQPGDKLFKEPMLLNYIQKGQILAVLKNGGMDSMSAEKSMRQILDIIES